jgi:putative nucleotidyltransferase with HDIG domain
MYHLINQKIAISIDEIAKQAELQYSVYSAEGMLLASKGENIDQKMVKFLSVNELYRVASPEEVLENGKLISKISHNAAEKLLDITSLFLRLAEKQETPEIEAFYSARDIIYHEVKANINRIKNIGELKIYYNDYYLTHVINVSALSTALAMKMGMNDNELKDIALAGLLHDIGMTRMPRSILDKPSRLTPIEYDLIKFHTRIGYKIIKEEYFIDEHIAIVALEHHERYNGSGYPANLKGKEISDIAQIVALADVYDASSSNKVYARKKAPELIIEELYKLKKSFNPVILNLLVKMVQPSSYE